MTKALKKLIITTLGVFAGQVKIKRGTLRGTYNVYEFFGKSYEFKV